MDTNGLVSLLMNEPAAGDVAALLEQGGVAVTPAHLAETVDVLERKRGALPERLDESLQEMVDAGLAVVVLEARDGRTAGHVRARHYHLRTTELSLADCLLLAAAMNRDAGIATSDRVLARVARSEGIGVVPLANSAGQLP